ncbi:ATP-binding cassette domain-containing protein [Nonomuraea basaltis]|uniref:ATP-binding cassette domain-containing protein n=1 Tax=Nonomuraea basaltis TaxID=2495887 RepID=UPI00110C5B44|nr:ATP-binding cassette domain-containing protein [Nonomuraea basaltis]TMR94914.1 sugar ABC transporter ATP-binding protein [Nonomuraea basaltis]
MNAHDHAAAAPALEVKDLVKNYGAVRALSGVSMRVRRGEVVGLLGDNGAGKSTLVKCISGSIPPTSGQILVDARHVRFARPEDAREAGIETVHQDLAVVESMDVTANLFLNRELVRPGLLGRLGWLDKKAMERAAHEALDRLGIHIPSFHSDVGLLSGGQRQAVAVGRAVAWGRHIVLLDEPAAALGVEQSAQVLALCERLAAQDVAVILVSHNMQHVLDVCTRAVVLRHGHVIADQPMAGLTGQGLVALITGADEPLKGVRP